MNVKLFGDHRAERRQLKVEKTFSCPYEKRQMNPGTLETGDL